MDLKEGINNSKSIFLEEINFDINDILSFTVNIDNLKIFLSTLLKNQNLLSKKILEIETKINLKNAIIDTQTIRNKFSKSIKGNLNKLQKDHYQIQSKKEDIIFLKKNVQNDNENKAKMINEIKEKNIEEKKIENKILNDNNKEKESSDEKEEINNEDNNEDNNDKIIKDNEENKELYSSKDNDKNDNEMSFTDKENKNKNEINLQFSQNGENENINGKNKDKKENDNERKENDNEKKENDNEKKENNNEKKEKEENKNIDYDLFEINDKIKTLQKKINNLELLNKIKDYTSNLGDKGEDIQMLKLMVNDLKTDNENFKKENEDIKKQLENVNVKLTDINIFELFKETKFEEGSIDASKALIMSFEQKFAKKNDLIDEKFKKLFIDFLDLKTKLQNIVNKNGVMEHLLNDIRKNFKELGELFSKTNNETVNNMNNYENKMNKIYKELFNKYDEKNNIIESNIKKINDKILNLEKLKNENMNLNNINNNNNLELNEETLQFLTTLNNRINEIEKKINSILDSSQLNPTKEDIDKLEKEISQKLNTKDFYELKEKYNIQLAKTNNLEEYIERIQDVSEKNNSEFIYYTKKIENLTSNVVTMRAQIDELTHKEENKLLDLSRFLEKITFHKYLNSTLNEKKKIENNFEEIRKIINEISNTIKKKCSEEDLKVFENIFNNKIEDLQLTNNKRFADKIDTNKSMKYLDTQIRHIIDVYIKRMEKNDSWLIAKKPIGGFTCASCESYLGELKNKGEYLPWNKYPQREKDNFRVGNGFSRMLNMLNVELKNNETNSVEKNFESDDEIKISENNRFKMRIKNTPKTHRALKSNKSTASAIYKNIYSTNLNQSNMLPKINMKNEEMNSIEPNHNIDIGIETTSGILVDEHTLKEYNESQPHIVKIIKKIKTTSTDSSRTERQDIHQIK